MQTLKAEIVSDQMCVGLLLESYNVLNIQLAERLNVTFSLH